jgi:hypothetical protein
MMHNFRLEETTAGLPLKHNMFSCWFALGAHCMCMETHTESPWNE